MISLKLSCKRRIIGLSLSNSLKKHTIGRRKESPMTRYAVLFLLLGFAAALAGDVRKVDLTVDGMHCKVCTDKVKSALQKVKDVKDVSVSLKEGTAQVSLEAASEINAEALAKAVSDAGYTASYKDGEQTKTVKAVEDKPADKDCPQMMGDKKGDCAKGMKSDCCMDKSTKSKTTKTRSTKK